MRRGVVMHAVVGRRERHGGDVQHAHAVRLGPCAARRQQLGHLGGGTALPPPTPLPEPRLILDLSRLFLFHRARACYWKASDTMARISALEDYVTDSWSESILLKYQPELETCGSMGSLANQCAEACFGSSCVAVCCPVGFQLTLLPQGRPQATIPVPVRLGYHQPLPRGLSERGMPVRAAAAPGSGATARPRPPTRSPEQPRPVSHGDVAQAVTLPRL